MVCLGQRPNATWNAHHLSGLHFVTKPAFAFSPHPNVYASTPVPTLPDWRQLWAAWDTVTLKMIPENELLSKPIKLRHVPLFYLGHIPTFLDIHLTRATDKSPTDPADFHRIFERGIDPDVDNPDICHDHSEVPEVWPPLADVVKYQKAVRERLQALYDSGAAENDRRVAQAIWLGFEHEAMHLETLLYMLLQSEKVELPTGVVVPDFKALSDFSERTAVDNQWFTVPDSDITIGLDDTSEASSGTEYFGWDNEKPQRSLHVQSFRAKARPITNGEYAEYMAKTGKTTVPASWREATASDQKNGVSGKRDSVVNGDSHGLSDLARDLAEDKYIRTVYGNIPLRYALNWPVMASYDELASCAQWMGGRVPTMEEARSIYNFVEHRKTQKFDKALGHTIPAVNGHLINNGVDETPPSHPLSNGDSGTASGPQPRDLFIDLEDSNVAFKHWHPTSVVEKGGQLCGQSDLGGVWEWTSSVLEKHDGFEPMSLYLGYTADFFDGKHNIVLGGSWATHPRLAGRKTL
jgi:formylglycine-generating enzyme required for sulfatase activity